MNERIRELAEQAREYATTRHQVSNIVLSINNDKFEQKFAELIVQECIDQCADIPNSGEEYDKGIRWAANQIKQHFGVEE